MGETQPQSQDSMHYQDHRPVDRMLVVEGGHMAGTVEHGWHAQEYATKAFGCAEQHQVDTLLHWQVLGPGGGTAVPAAAVEG